MSGKEIFHLWVVICFVGAAGASPSGAAAPTYTATGLIRVLPYAEKDPMTIETPAVDAAVQECFRGSVAALIKRQEMLQQLIGAEWIQATKWLRSLGDVENQRYDVFKKALAELHKNFGVDVQEETDFVELSMTCGEPDEAALIVNELAQLFIGAQQQKKQGQVRAKLANLEQQRASLQRDLDSAERSLEEVRTRWGFTDLEDHNYAHPVVVRLNRLQSLRDDMLLEVRGLEATISDLKERKVDFEALRAQLIPRRAKLDELEKMVEQAGAKKKDFDLARIQYRQRAAVRDRMSEHLGAVVILIEKYKIMHDDPDIAKVRVVGRAVEPLAPDSTDQ